MYKVVKSIQDINVDHEIMRKTNKKPFNIFNNHLESHSYDFKPNKIKPYQVVGYENIKHFHNSMKKTHKYSCKK